MSGLNINTYGTVQRGKGTVLELNPEARTHFNHHEEMDRKTSAQRRALSDANDELRGLIVQSHANEAILEREYVKYGEPTEQGADGKPQIADWRKRFREERARWKAATEANSRAIKNISRHTFDELELFVTTKRLWRSIALETIAEVSIAEVRERAGNLTKIEKEEREIENANRTDAEIELKIRAEFERIAARGALDFRGLMQGGSFLHDGAFSPANRNASLQFPTTLARVHDSEGRDVAVEVEAAFAIAFRYGDREKILANVLADARAANAGKPQISEADKVKLLREISERKLAAQRSLEAAYRAAEAQGLTVKRRELPPHVLLWLELDTSAPVTKPNTKAVAPVEDADAEIDFEGADA